MELKEYIVGFVMAGLVILAMFMFANGYAQDNNVPFNNSVGGSPYLNSSYSQLQNNLGGLQTTFNQTYNEIQTEDFVSSTFTIIFTSLPNAVRLGMGSVLGSGNIIFNVLLVQVLGIPLIVIAVILALLIFILLLRFYRVTRTGFE